LSNNPDTFLKAFAYNPGETMKSAIAEAIALRFPPLAIFYAHEPPSEGTRTSAFSARNKNLKNHRKSKP